MSSSTSLSRGRQPRSDNGQRNLHTFTLDNENYTLHTGQWKLHIFILVKEKYLLSHWSMKLTHFHTGQWKLPAFTLVNENYTLSHWSMEITRFHIGQWKLHFHTGQWKLHTFTLVNGQWKLTAFTLDNEHYTLSHWTMILTYFHTSQWQSHTGQWKSHISHWSIKITHFRTGQWKLHAHFHTGQWKLHTFTLVSENYTLSQWYFHNGQWILHTFALDNNYLLSHCLMIITYKSPICAPSRLSEASPVLSLKTCPSSVQGGIYTVGRIHMRFTQSQRGFPYDALEAVPVFVWLTVAFSRHLKEDYRTRHLSMPLSSRWSLMWCPSPQDEYVTPKKRKWEFRSCVRVEVAVLGCPS